MARSSAKRYARAIFELAKEQGQIEAWAERLEPLREVLTHPQAKAILANPSIDVGRRQDAVGALLDGRAGPEGLNLAKLLVGANRIDDLDAIVEEYGRLADEDAGRVRATATTAVALSRSEAGNLVESLSRRWGLEVRLDVRVDPRIIGGLVLRIGDRVIDASVAARLQQLRRRLVGV